MAKWDTVLLLKKANQGMEISKTFESKILLERDALVPLVKCMTVWGMESTTPDKVVEQVMAACAEHFCPIALNHGLGLVETVGALRRAAEIVDHEIMIRDGKFKEYLT